MRLRVIKKGMKNIFTDQMLPRITCPGCDYIHNVYVSGWRSVSLIEEDNETIGVRYECPKCLCVFEYHKVET